MKLVRRVSNVFDRINSLFAAMVGLILLWLMLCVSYTVVIRYIWGETIPWLFEIWEYSLLWIPFLGAAWLLQREGHVNMDFVVIRLKPRTQAALNTITSLLGAILFLAVTWYGTEATWETFQSVYRVPGILYPPFGPILMIIPIGSSLLFVQFWRRSYRHYRLWRTLSHNKQ